ncbi:VOC family protein [Haloplasma contractile]|uniref:Glyoxalase-bleomycin resistance protein-dioxygenase n=1 Tax=Haloplasma contractile SSD-17B TaxID=1033810 RepID=U2DS35_9MOLU|nr:VOC family protein [Haloplasma contractile]ERJ11367.1 glyoxalase-bleomycin resistance protein-dioxygenase [Haloplasma contractile SSD-17B]
MKIISGIQQMGIGVPNINEAFNWYRKNLGFDIPVIDDEGVAELMLRYTGGEPQNRHAIIAINMQGGGGLEFWQYTSRSPQSASFEIQAGDLGIFITKLKCKDVPSAYDQFKKSSVNVIGNITEDPKGNTTFFLKDPYDNIFQIVESTDVYSKTKVPTGGVVGAIIGVTDMEKAINFYKEVLGYDEIIYDEQGMFEDFKLLPGGYNEFRRILITHSKPRIGAFSKIFGRSEIELIQILEGPQRKIYEDRYWGDLGFIQICFDIHDMGDLKKHCSKSGHPFTVDSNPKVYESDSETFNMGDASGHFTYTEDPDGTLIEFVETYKIPIIKKIGFFLNMKKRKPEKPLPNWLIKALAFNRIKD